MVSLTWNLFYRARLQSQAQNSAHQNILHSIHFRHIAMERNKRCLVAYHYNRAECLRNIRWNLGGIIPREIRSTLSEKEVEWFNSYNAELTNYMVELDGLNLTVHQRPPKEHFIHVSSRQKMLIKLILHRYCYNYIVSEIGSKLQLDGLFIFCVGSCTFGLRRLRNGRWRDHPPQEIYSPRFTENRMRTSYTTRSTRACSSMTAAYLWKC